MQALNPFRCIIYAFRPFNCWDVLQSKKGFDIVDISIQTIQNYNDAC